MKKWDKSSILATIFVIVIPIALVILIGWYEYSMWTECTNTNSFWYCLRVLSE